MSDQKPSTNRNRYQPTQENFVLRVKKLLCDLAIQGVLLRDKSEQPVVPPDSQKSPETRV